MAIDLNQAVFGTDVSHHQGHIDWPTFAAVENHRWTYIKATEGTSGPGSISPTFLANAQQSKGLIPRGAYHFARPENQPDPIKEAQNFLNMVEQAGGAQNFELRPMLDLEEPKSGTWTKKVPPKGQKAFLWVSNWLDYVERETGSRPILYTGPNTLNQLEMPDADFKTLAWVPRYPNAKPQTLSLSTQAVQLYKDSPAWAKKVNARIANMPTDIWQYTGHGVMAGTKYRVDMNLTDEQTFSEMKANSGLNLAGGGAFFLVVAIAFYLVKKG